MLSISTVVMLVILISLHHKLTLDLQSSFSLGQKKQKFDVNITIGNNISSDLFTILEENDEGPPDMVQARGISHPRNISTHSCWRKCPQRINKIIFKHGRAGLGDRLTVIENLAQIAGYLCANLKMPSPFESLNPVHNNGNFVSKKLKWLDFRNLTFLQDDSQVLDSNDSDDDDHEIEKVPGWLHIINDGSDSSNGLLEDFVRLQEFSLMQETMARTGFIWEIRTSFYESNLFDQLLPPPSVQVQDLSEYQDQMLPELRTYYYFHPKEIESNRQRCVYTNNNSSRLQPTSMVSLKFCLRGRRFPARCAMLH